MPLPTRRITLCLLLLVAGGASAQDNRNALNSLAEKIQPSLVTWRRHLHQNPELGNREIKTAAYIVQQLQGLGLEIRRGIGKTGVLAILRGEKPGPCV
ncbi:MAG TPA: amidohydrolase, partial [Ferruginibacter sp.]|nr:amidohydrolase [Ferruginibacter sp.]